MGRFGGGEEYGQNTLYVKYLIKLKIEWFLYICRMILGVYIVISNMPFFHMSFLIQYSCFSTAP